MEKSKIGAVEFLLVLGLSLSVCCWYSLSRGQDRSFDQLSYHTYAGWALNGRVAQDILVTGSTTYLNQYLYAPYYFFISTYPPRIAGAILGALHGFNIVLLYILVRRLLRFNQRRLLIVASVLVTAAGAASPMFLSEIGTSFADNLSGLLILTGLLLLFRALDAEWRIERRPDFLAAGLIFGLAAGLKLTNGVFLAGILVALAVMRTTWPDRIARTAVFAGSILVGGVIGAGPIVWKLWHEFQNPLYPFHNHIFKSPYFPQLALTDTRWLPHSLVHGLSYPFQWMVRMAPTNEIPFRDVRFGIIVTLAAMAGLLWALKLVASDYLLPKSTERKNPDPIIRVETSRVLLVFFFVSYLGWLLLFSIQRYIVPLELLTGLVMLILVDYLVQKREMKLGGIVLLSLSAVTTVTVPDWGHVRWTSSWYGFKIPNELKTEGVLYLVVSDLVGHICPSLPRSSRYIAVRQPHGLDKAKPLFDRIEEIIKSNRGPIRLLGKASDFPANRLSWANWINFYGLRPGLGTCTRIEGTYDGHVACLLEPMLLPSDPASVLRTGMAEGSGLRGYQAGAVKFGRSFTVEAVVTPGTPQKPLATIISNQPRGGAMQGLVVERVGPASQDYEVKLGHGSGWMQVGRVALVSGRRAYLCLVVDGLRTMLFLDGRPVRSVKLPRLIAESDAPLIVGNWAGPASDHSFIGLIEEVRVTKRALQESEVQQISGRVLKFVPPKSEDPGVMEFEIGSVKTELPDEVGRFEIQPDGRPDNKIQLRVIGGAGRISSVQVDLSAVDGRGEGCWDTKSSTTFWMVGIYRRNQPLVVKKSPDLQLAVKGGDEIDLRVTGNGSLRAGKRLLVTLAMQDGRVVRLPALIP